jgi:hypothetical protein
MQDLPVRLDPDLRFLMIGAQLLDESPKPPGMVVFFGMRQFMQDDVIAHEVRHLDQSPI